jgi:hypothetical protein
MNDARTLLDKLMGVGRNSVGPVTKKGVHYSDPEVCKSFLVKFCSGEQFRNTKLAGAACNLIHDEKVKTDFEYSNDLAYRLKCLKDCLANFEKYVIDVDRNVRRTQERINASRPLNPDEQARSRHVMRADAPKG